MIRRNHIETGSKIDRDGLKYRPKPIKEDNPSAQRHSNKISPELTQGENNRITSNHKKYHQYKEDRESKNKVEEFKADAKWQSVPLGQQSRQHDYHYEENNPLKRDYTYDLDDTLKIDYNSISLKANNYPQKEASKTANTIKPQPERVPLAKINSNSYNPSLDRTVALSPTKNRTIIPSSQKYEFKRYSNFEQYPPLFEQGNYSYCKKQFDGQSSVKREVEAGKIYERTSKIVKTDYQHLREQSKRRPSQQRNIISVQNYSSNPSYSNPINNNTNAINYTSASVPLKPQPPSLQSFNAPSLPPSYHKQQVSEKLRMISDFNDQINQRIKNIIGCFEGLKSKF